jgi:hypothetical protein
MLMLCRLIRVPGSAAANRAVTLVDAAASITHTPCPEQPPPDHPLKLDPSAGFAVSRTDVPSANTCEQLRLQLRPAGLLETEPAPVPANDNETVAAAAT